MNKKKKKEKKLFDWLDQAVDKQDPAALMQALRRPASEVWDERLIEERGDEIPVIIPSTLIGMFVGMVIRSNLSTEDYAALYCQFGEFFEDLAAETRKRDNENLTDLEKLTVKAMEPALEKKDKGKKK